jgi:hypothetical protein
VPASRDAAPYETWAAGIRAGRAVVTNGPLLELRVAGREPGAILDVESAESVATATFHRPIEKLEIVANGRIVASAAGDGKRTELALTFRVPTPESTWIAARVLAAREPEEPEVRAHTNPVYVLRSGRPVRIESAREAVLKRWRAETDYYRSGGLTFARDAERRELLAKVDAALAALAR